MKLILMSDRDRLSFHLGITNVLGCVLLFVIADTFWFYFWAVFNGLSAVLQFVSVYFFPDKTNSAEGTEYAQVIVQLDKTQNVLKSMSVFLEQERLRVNQTEQTVRRLEGERAALEPVVKTQRETVEAILRAHASTVRAYAWKDRLMGFGIGVLSSMVAGAILYTLGIGR